MTSITLSAIHIYPVKSMAGVNLAAATTDAMGLRLDRRWMLVDAHGDFITARTRPQLLTLRPQIDADNGLSLDFADGSRRQVAAAHADSPRLAVKVWNDRVNARHPDAAADAMLSEFLQQPCRLVFIDDDEIRAVDPLYARSGDRTGFSDGFPLLLISQASLDDLNSRLAEPVTMQQFRPNLVVSGCEPYAEDRWRHIQIGEVCLDLVKPCSRCIMTTMDPVRGKSKGKEPLHTLSQYRRQGNKVMFGQNLIHRNLGSLRLGDTVTLHD